LARIYYAIRKSAHWAEYLLLSILLLRALRSDPKRKWEKRHAVWALVIVFFYALGDEFHQSFVPNRMASFRDVMIDWFGGICGAFWMYLRHKGNRGPEGKARMS
jgi:VanZ family protein